MPLKQPNGASHSEPVMGGSSQRRIESGLAFPHCKATWSWQSRTQAASSHVVPVVRHGTRTRMRHKHEHKHKHRRAPLSSDDGWVWGGRGGLTLRKHLEDFICDVFWHHAAFLVAVHKCSAARNGETPEYQPAHLYRGQGARLS